MAGSLRPLTVSLCLIVCIASLRASAQSDPPITVLQGEEPDGVSSGDLIRPAKMGNLQRVVASLESTLDTYRLALGECVLAVEFLVDIGESDGALPSRALPQNARDVFVRLSRVLSSRVPADALAPIPRGHHYEALDALEKLAAATTLGEIRGPLVAFSDALGRLTSVADEVVDLFSRQRPIQVQIFDADTALEQISDALDAVAEAERKILALRARGAGLNEQFQAFLFLEISLGNALDLIAAAEEAGINVGFELQLALDGFKAKLARVRLRSETLAELVERIERRPRIVARSLRAWTVPSEAGDELRLTFGVRGRDSPAAWRVDVQVDHESFRRHESEALRCGGVDEEEIELRVSSKLQEIDVGYRRLGYLDASRREASFGFDGVELPYRVSVVAVNAFDVAADSPAESSVFVPDESGTLAPVQARLIELTPYDKAFYADHDRVDLSWSLAPGDPKRDTPVELDGGAQVTGYMVRRGEEEVALLSSGATSWLDRVPLDRLAAGISYRVVAQLAGGGELASRACPALDNVEADRRFDRELATAGARHLERPTEIEREVEARLRADAVKQTEVWREFEQLPDSERDRWLRTWWQGVDEQQRTGWLADWVSLHGGEDSEWFRKIPAVIAERDRGWVYASLWLEEQDAVVRGEVSRIWKLLAPSARSEAERRWFEQRGQAWQKTLTQQLKDGDEFVRRKVLTPARTEFWLNSKDPQERALVTAWWEGLDDEGRSSRMREWLDRQPRELVRELRWPATDSLEDDERQLRLNDAYLDLPEGLRASFLAWWRFEKLRGDELIDAVRSEVPFFKIWWERLRYASRPIDRWTGFNGAWLLVVYAGVMLLVIGWLWTRRRRRVRRIVGPPSEGAELL